VKSSTVNISFNDELLRKIDAVAEEESRSRSELIREAARSYIERRARWARLFDFADRHARRMRLTPADVEAEIAAHRSGRR
jgi:CopG family transcriptional regulator/antitoxin EndoAI